MVYDNIRVVTRRSLHQGKAQKSVKAPKTSERCQEAGGLNGDGGGRKRTEEHDGAGRACARGPVAT
eukprot:649101-Pleurochrysis_carterae.AAC.1